MLRYLAGDLAMYRRDTFQGMEGTSEHLNGFLHRRAIASDHALVRSVYDEQVHSVELLQDLPCPSGLRLDHAHAPFHFCVFRESPGLPCGVAASGQVGHEQLTFHHASEHLIPLVPRAHRKQSGSLAERIPYDRVRTDAEARHQVRRDRAESDLREYDRSGVRDARSVPPDFGRLELRFQPFIPAVLSTQDLRPLQTELPPHAGVLASRSGVDKGQFSLGSKGVG